MALVDFTSLTRQLHLQLPSLHFRMPALCIAARLGLGHMQRTSAEDKDAPILLQH